jgi:CheY-like chemotaxis protein
MERVNFTDYLPSVESRVDLLLVDDEPTVHAVLASCLGKLPINLCYAQTGAEGRAMARQRTFDLILLDIGLPDENGFELLRWLKSSPGIQSVPVIVLTAARDFEEVVKGFELGAHDYITKPVETAVLRARINACLRTQLMLNRLEEARAAAADGAQEKTRFLSSLSHELHTALNGIVPMTELLMESNLLPNEREVVRTLQFSVRRLWMTTDNMLDVLKLESGALETEQILFPLAPTVEKCLRLWEPAAQEKKLTLALQLSPTLPADLVGDPEHLEMILGNIFNSLIAENQAGHIALAIASAPPCLDSSSPATPRKHCLAIRFTARRVSRLAAQLRLLPPSAQAPSEPARTAPAAVSPGPEFVARIVAAWGGNLSVEPEENGDFSLSLRLPFGLPDAPDNADGSVAKPALVKPSGSAPVPLPVKILVVDDDGTNRQILKRMFTQLGCAIDVAESAMEAVEAIRLSAYDMVFTDIMMGEIGGVEATRLYREADSPWHAIRGRGLFIVALTASALAGDRKKFLSAGMDDYLSKPLRPNILRDFISRFIGTYPPPLPAPPVPSAAPRPAANTILDEDRLREFTEDDPGILQELSQAFLRENRKRLVKLHAAIASGDFEAVRHLAHTIHGSSATLGALAVQVPLRALEVAAAESRSEGLPALCQQAEVEFTRLESRLAHLLAAPPTALDRAQLPQPGPK